MAYYYILSYRKPVLILILLILHKSEHVRAARSLSDCDERPPLLRIKLGITRLDSQPAGNFSYAHLQEVLRRSSLRVERFGRMLQLNGGGTGAAASASRYRQLGTAPSNYEAPVFSDSIGGEFLTTLSIGTPPVSFNAIVDTGSALVWLQCKPCVSCFTNQGPNIIFDPSLSSSYSKLPCSSPTCSYLSSACDSSANPPSCNYTDSYGDSSQTIGDLSLDALTLPDPSGASQIIPNFVFGCGHNNQGDFNGSTDGIVGLDLGPLSLPSQLGVSYLSYCLQSITDPTSNTSPLYLGDVALVPQNSNGMTLTTQFFKNPITGSQHYYVQLNAISVGGQLVPASLNGTFDIQSNGSGGMIFDSGTTITYLPSDTYNGVVEAFMSAITLPRASTNDASTLCYDLSSASNIQFPPLTFHFEGADVDLPSANYFIPLEESNLTCLALAPSGTQSTSIFGNVQQQNFFITYDLKAYTLSLTPTTCDSS